MLKIGRAPNVLALLRVPSTPLTWAIVTAVVVRVAWALYAAGAGPLFLLSGDQYSYWYLGKSLSDGDGYSLPSSDGPTAYYPVGFPLILAALYWATNHTPLPDGEVWITTAYHVVVGAGSVWLVHLVASAVYDRRAGDVAAWLTALFPGLVFYVATFSVELTFIALTLAALAIAVRHDWCSGRLPSTRRLAAFGIALGAATMVRPFAIPLLLGLLVACAQTSTEWRRVLRAAAVPAVVVAAMALPWTVRNAVQMDAFVPISTNLGDTLCMDRTEEANGTFRFTGAGCADPTIGEVSRSSINTMRALVFVLEDPLKEAHLIAMRAYRMMEHDHTGLDEIEANESVTFSDSAAGAVLRAVSDTWFFLIGACALVTVARDRRRLCATPQRTLLTVTSAGLLVIPLGLWGNPRFHVPLLPLMAIAAASGIATAWRRRGSRALL